MTSTRSEGGIERYALRLAREMRARGLPLLYACRPGAFVAAQCRADGIPGTPLRVRNSGDMLASVRLAHIISRHRIDIVHVHSRRDYVPAVFGVILARTLGRRVRLVLHAHLIRALGTPAYLNGRFYRATVDAVIAVSRAVQEFLEREHGFPPGFVRLIHNGVDTTAFAPAGTEAAMTHREALRREWHIPADALVIGMVGRLNAKGQDWLMQILPALTARVPTLRLVLVGPEGADGDRERLTGQAQALGVPDRVTLAGARDDIPVVLNAFDVLAHLPTDESFGLALVEAMAAGLPTVATDVGGCREVVRGGVTGCLVTPDDTPALSSALARLLGDPLARRRMGEAGRRVAEDEFSFARQADRLQDLYTELCSSPSRS